VAPSFGPVLARSRTLTLNGVDAVPVDVEIDIHTGLPAFSVVGLPDTAVRESRERVRAAIVNSGFKFPQLRITASLAPADLRKAGPGFDLAIAAGILVASEQLRNDALEGWWLAGELALDGTVRSLPGVLAMAEAVSHRGGGIVVASPNYGEARLVDGVQVAPISHLRDLIRLAEGEVIEPAADDAPVVREAIGPIPDLRDLRGQLGLRRGLEVAAAGGHGMLIVGPPGAGKSMAARRLPSILPPLSPEQAIEATKIASIAGRAPAGALTVRPFRAPHHTISPAGLVGGGAPPRPGEITLAHHGVLFLDEIAEFSRAGLEALRQPLETGEVTIARAQNAVTFPARFQLIASANPCPCGHGPESPRCVCSPDRVRLYEGKLSGALADRIDISISVTQPSAAALAGDPGEPSADVAARVAAARLRQEERLGQGRCNASMSEEELSKRVEMTDAAATAIADGHASLGLSGRGWTRVLKVARTIADLAGSEKVDEPHISEALALRRREG
jgi:magnesium chelatase family protein